MKHNFIRKILSLMLSCSIMMLCSINVSSEENNVLNTLEIYRHKFEVFNEKYGTDFQIATFDMTETELNDLLVQYSEMTDEEFEEYFLDMKEKCECFLQAQSENIMIYNEKKIYSNNNPLQNDNDTTYEVENVTFLDK